MYKTALVRRVARETGVSQRVVRQVVGASLQHHRSRADGRGAGELPGFGTFYTSQRQAGRIRSVRTGRQVEVPARRVAAFRVGEVLKRAVAAKRRGRRRLFGLSL